jgi:hypothetical protein
VVFTRCAREKTTEQQAATDRLQGARANVCKIGTRYFPGRGRVAARANRATIIISDAERKIAPAGRAMKKRAHPPPYPPNHPGIIGRLLILKAIAPRMTWRRLSDARPNHYGLYDAIVHRILIRISLSLPTTPHRCSPLPPPPRQYLTGCPFDGSLLSSGLLRHIVPPSSSHDIRDNKGLDSLPGLAFVLCLISRIR